jgi:four helix bundle protein
MLGSRYDLEDRLIRFATDVCRFAEQLPTTVIGKHVTQQVIRSSTSPLANYGEVQGAESRRDFIHKLGICLKELRETRAWLKLTVSLGLCADPAADVVLHECDELLAILATSIRTARLNGRRERQDREM